MGTLPRNLFCAAILILGVASSAVADEAQGVKASTSFNFVLATTRETKAKLIETVEIPLLVGNGALTSGNNLQIKAAAEISPVSVNGTAEFRLTPIAFLQFVAGGSVGSGWNIPIANGLRKNERANAHDSEFTGGPLDGIVWSVRGGGLFQFDLAAVMPGDWHHLVFQTYHEAKYRALTSASSDDSWLYESDSGENRNGWNYYGNYFLGYQMPIVLNTAGVLIEEDLYLFNTDGRSFWGDNLPRWTFGPLFNFTVTKNLLLAVLVQAHSMRNFTEETKDFTFYQNRQISDSNKLRIEFYRAALNLTWKLK